MCRFDLQDEDDCDVYNIVKGNMIWVYGEALHELVVHQRLEAIAPLVEGLPIQRESSQGASSSKNFDRQ